jgi:type I restriction enzyme S subunit
MASTSAGQLTVNQEALGSLAIPVPSLADQRRITATLNEQITSAERARKAIEEELDAINKLPAALLRRAFSGGL